MDENAPNVANIKYPILSLEPSYSSKYTFINELINNKTIMIDLAV